MRSGASDQRDHVIFQVRSLASGALVLIWLLAGAIFFTFYFNFINIRGFGHALDVVRGKYDDPNDAGSQPLPGAKPVLSGTVGVGNIAGVAFEPLGEFRGDLWMIGRTAWNESVECTLGTSTAWKTRMARSVVPCTPEGRLG